MYSLKSSRLSTLTNANNSLPSFQAAFVLTLNVFKCASSCNLINKQFYQLLTWPFRILLISSQSSFSDSIHRSWLTTDEIYPWYDHYVPLFFTFSWKDMFWTANWFHMTPYWWGFTFNLYCFTWVQSTKWSTPEETCSHTLTIGTYIGLTLICLEYNQHSYNGRITVFEN